MNDTNRSAFPLAALSQLRFPSLFLIFGLLFLLDLFIPDLLPFADEIFLGLVTLMLGSLRRGGSGGAKEAIKPPEKNITPPGH